MRVLNGWSLEWVESWMGGVLIGRSLDWEEYWLGVMNGWSLESMESWLGGVLNEWSLEWVESWIDGVLIGRSLDWEESWLGGLELNLNGRRLWSQLTWTTASRTLLDDASHANFWTNNATKDLIFSGENQFPEVIEDRENSGRGHRPYQRDSGLPATTAIQIWDHARLDHCNTLSLTISHYMKYKVARETRWSSGL